MTLTAAQNMDHDKFVYKKLSYTEKDWKRFFWYVINRETKQGVHFHGQQYAKEYWDTKRHLLDHNNFCFSAHGIEMHLTAPRYEEHKPLPNCDVTGGDCYCDGSSLQASEALGHINPDGSDDAFIWRTLEYYYRIWVEQDREAA